MGATAQSSKQKRREKQISRRQSAGSCAVASCQNKASAAKGLCHTHYKSTSTCSIDGCERPVHGRTFCLNHYLQARRAKQFETKPCLIDGCSKPAEQIGMCYMHFFRVSKFGDPNARKRIANGEATDEVRKAQQKARWKKYIRTEAGKLRRKFNNAKRRVLAGASPGIFDKDEFLKLWNTRNCGICLTEMDETTKSIDHVIPLARGGDNTMGNLQMAHLICNQRKNANLPALTSTDA